MHTHTHTQSGRKLEKTHSRGENRRWAVLGILKALAVSALVCSIFLPSFFAASQGEVVAQNGLLIGRGLMGHM